MMIMNTQLILLFLTHSQMIFEIVFDDGDTGTGIMKVLMIQLMNQLVVQLQVIYILLHLIVILQLAQVHLMLLFKSVRNWNCR